MIFDPVSRTETETETGPESEPESEIVPKIGVFLTCSSKSLCFDNNDDDFLVEFAVVRDSFLSFLAGIE